ncbi:hypothetical protein [Plantibacter sp. RU18]|uniref:hypothetical protein n=1 Tax=Plantibacter sp. RU18 TaxID=3158143 RepID=UPI003D365098
MEPTSQIEARPITWSPRSAARVLASLAVAAALVLVSSTPASATGAGTTSGLPAEQRQEVAETEIAFASLDRSSNTFDFQAAVNAGVSTGAAERFAYGVLLAGGDIVNSAVPITLPDDLAEIAPQLKACAGTNTVSTEWYGHRVQMDSCITTRVITIIGGSGGIAGAAAYLSAAFPPVAAVAGIVAAAMAIVGGGLAICGSNGHGLVMYQVWTGQPWCTGP